MAAVTADNAEIRSMFTGIIETAGKVESIEQN
jgi:hypothetical protein